MFSPAERKQAKLKIALSGPSGSGKTFSALLLAKGLGSKIALVDTENGSASLYSNSDGIPKFDVAEMHPPYLVDKYLKAIQEAEKAGYEVLILDSISHQWAGEGGILNKKEQLDQRGGNSYTNWAKLTPEQEKFKSAILNSGIHIICTMRSKQEYALIQNDKGKMEPKKLGLAPIQRDGMEYEFTTVLDIAMNHEAVASKDRTGLFDQKIFKISEETGKALIKWLHEGKPIPKPTPKIEEPQTEPGPPTDWENEEFDPQQFAQEGVPDAGNFEFTAGKYKGMRIRDVPSSELPGYIKFYRNKERETKIPLEEPMLSAIQMAEIFLKEMQ